ncbi:MAG: hypothetical protein F9K23_15900 [Bacteroidetes bacterium]|nr:MAG: hypothetical protein F9K23_15900 [Bacteroidota bacterium]
MISSLDFQPLPTTVIERAKAANELYNRFETGYQVAAKKGGRARTIESINKWSEKRNYYHDLRIRAIDLIKRLAGYRTMGFETLRDYWRWRGQGDRKYETLQKEKRRTEFENKHTYSPWFYSNSFSADYGTYTCDSCQRTFHHSPSTIKLAGKVVYNCACGSCTNSIIYRDWRRNPYQ